jgi:hypothetical protein
MTHPTDDDYRLHGALEQDRRERDWDRNWGVIEALRETRHLGPVVGTLVVAAVAIYAAAWATGQGDVLGGLVIGAVAIVCGGLWLDTELCKGTPAHVHECRRCRRETDRWRGSTRDDMWVTSLVGQRSAAARTPPPNRYRQPAPPQPRSWDGDAEPAVRKTVEPRSVTAEPPAVVDGVQPQPFGGEVDD